MDPFIDFLLGFLSIAFLLETMILIGFFISGERRTHESSSFLKRFHEWMDKWDNDGTRWKKMGEGYLLIGAGVICLEIGQFFSCLNNPSINFSWVVQALEKLFSLISPGLAIVGIGMAIYAFGVSLIDGQIIKTNLENIK
jgi:hypothetical protein